MWVLDFASTLDSDFVQGAYKSACRYPFHSSDYAGIEILTPEGAVTQSKGDFEVIKLVKGKDGEIKSLALDFRIENEEGEIVEGSIRFNSKLPIDLMDPFYYWSFDHWNYK